MEDSTIKDLIAAALGVLAFALGAGAILGLVRPADGVAASNVPLLAVAGMFAGIVGLYIGPMRGRFGRQIAVIGTGVALIGLALFGGSVAIDLILEVGE